MKLNEPTHKLSYGAPPPPGGRAATPADHQAPAAPPFPFPFPFPIAELSPRIATTIDDLDRWLGSA